MPDEKIIDKLAKMLRHEQSARAIGSIAEAEAFAAKIQELLTEHKLEMSEVEWVERDKETIDEQHVNHYEIGVKREAKQIMWQQDLAWAIASANTCKILIVHDSNTIFFVGKTSDRQLCIALYSHFVRMALDVAEKHAERNYDMEQRKCKMKHLYSGTYSGAVFVQWMRTYRKSFCNGFSNALTRRFVASFRAAEKLKAERDGEQCSALVHVRKDIEAVNEWIEHRHRGAKVSRKKHKTDEGQDVHAGAFAAGVAAGETVALTPHALKGGK